MNELQSAAAVATGLKPAIDLAKSLLDLVGSGKGREQALKLYGEIVAAHSSALAAQQAQAALLKEKGQLEEQLAHLEAWSREKERYELKAIASGVFAFGLKAETQSPEPAHLLCANCFEHGDKSYLQSSGIGMLGTEDLCCSRCQSKLTISHPKPERAISRASDPVSWMAR